MDRGATFSRPVELVQRPDPNASGPSSRLTFSPASQAQILRASQRDTMQVHRLVEVTSELARSVAGTRWLNHKQSIIDLLVRAVYLVLTYGRGDRTLGEEYTDILPFHSASKRIPSRRRRLVTILFLLLPSILASPLAIARLRSNDPDSLSPWTKIRLRLASFLESPLGQAMPDLHTVAFMFGGRFLEFGKRLTGTSYMSTLPPKLPGQEAPSYEPLGLLMLLPILTRLWPRRAADQTIGEIGSSNVVPDGMSLSVPSTHTPALTSEASVVVSEGMSYDTPNTYLESEAQELPERQCTLCLEPRGTGEGSGGTVAVTECGHVFCWGCLGGLEKPECPLCRQSLRMERLIAAYNL